MDPQDLELLIRDKYNGDRSDEIAIAKDVERLAAGEPLAYVIGWVPFLGLHIELASPANPDIRPLIPRPETEWWTEKLIAHLREKFGEGESTAPFALLDLCAGSGAIGLAVLKNFPNAHVTFAEIVPELTNLIKKNCEENKINMKNVTILESDIFSSLANAHFDVIATNPPYIPENRELDASVAEFEPREALFSGPDGMDAITYIIDGAAEHLHADGELWMECDISNIHEARERASACGARTPTIHEDLSGRPRLLVAHFN